MKKNCATLFGYRTISAFRKTRPAVSEALEARQLLSAADPTIAPFLPNKDGYTPQQISKAYGFNLVSFNNGTIPGNGAGQTIAIVDAFDDPTIVSDLGVFDAQFGLPAPPSFKVENQNGGSDLPAPDAGWAGEISLDVEWSHAMAPAANILLVEANSDNDNGDLESAVDEARFTPGVSVVSCSWGGSEFVNFVQSESLSELSLDPIFTTPAGHIPITFVVSSGDLGSGGGTSWPSVAENVLAVGGTTLNLGTDGTYESEGLWEGSTSGAQGGLSSYETEPTYQNKIQTSGARSAPDVGYDANQTTGVAVYDTTGDVGWATEGGVGGTSAGAPQWASIIAIADQGRALAGKPTLDGPAQVLPTLYSVYAAPGTAGYSNYTTYFHDVTGTGYNYVAGLGSPLVQNIVPLLDTAATPIPTPTPTPSAITGVFLQSPPASVLPGTVESLKFKIINTGATQYVGPVGITLFASGDTILSPNDTQLSSPTYPKLTLNAKASKIVTLKFTYPAGLIPGSYDLIANVNGTAVSDTSSTNSISPSKVSIEPATVDLATTFSSGQAISVSAGKSENASITITNDGNVSATGTLGLNLYASTDQTLDVSDQLLASITSHRINIKSGRSITLRVHFVAPPGKTPGSYNLIASSTSSTSLLDANVANNVAVVGTA